MRVSAERIFRSHYPLARLERQRSNGPGAKPYFLVRAKGNQEMPSGYGDSRTQAWADACKRMKLTTLKVTEEG